MRAKKRGRLGRNSQLRHSNRPKLKVMEAHSGQLKLPLNWLLLLPLLPLLALPLSPTAQVMPLIPLRNTAAERVEQYAGVQYPSEQATVAAG